MTFCENCSTEHSNCYPASVRDFGAWMLSAKCITELSAKDLLVDGRSNQEEFVTDRGKGANQIEKSFSVPISAPDAAALHAALVHVAETNCVCENSEDCVVCSARRVGKVLWPEFHATESVRNMMLAEGAIRPSLDDVNQTIEKAMDMALSDKHETAARPLREAAKLLKVSDRTLWGLAVEGKIPHRKVGRQYRFIRADLLTSQPQENETEKR